MRHARNGFLAAVLLVSLGWSGKQKLVIKLREPLRAETVKIRVSELSNGRGEIRDLETKVELRTQAKPETQKIQAAALKLDMTVRTVGSQGVQVNLTLPTPGFVEVVMMDFYGKSLSTLFSGNLPSGGHAIGPFPVKVSDNGGMKFMTLRINGKMVLKKVMNKVK
jgi:hypothetical protein